MPLNPPQDFRSTDKTHRSGLFADRPAAGDVLIGTLYFATDTGTITRSDGAAWTAFGGGGAPGPAGANGAIGPPGVDGLDGADGIDGLTVVGPTGPRGLTGTAGTNGLQGPPGFDGNDGEDGISIPGTPGAAGANGATGATGPAGLQGPIGPQGIDGDEAEYPYIVPGPQGVAGNSIAAVMTNFTKDLGTADYSGTFDITGLAGLTVDKVVTVVQTAAKITSKGDARDEPEMDLIRLTGYVLDAATIRAYWYCNSVVVGTYAFAYVVNG